MYDLPERPIIPKNAVYWVWLSQCCYPGSIAADQLIDYFGYDPKVIFDADRAEYEKIRGLSKEVINRLCCKHSGGAQKVVDYCSHHGVGILTIDSPLYPDRLRRIQKRPVLLYYRGKLPDFIHRLYVATVGTRNLSEYGRREGYNIAYDLARAGAVVVSGMARGIDSVCHRAALDAGGFTIAVLGCGIDRAYPAENRPLMEEIFKKGLVVTEYPPFSPPTGAHFPIRNRIISGICHATFMIEGSEKSGSMITAKLADEQGRTVFALPGQVGEMESTGTNSLIQGDALPVVCAMDILREFLAFFPDTLMPDKILWNSTGYSGGNSSRGKNRRPAGGWPAGSSSSYAAESMREERRVPDGCDGGVGYVKRRVSPSAGGIPPLREEPLPIPEDVYIPEDALQKGRSPFPKAAAADRYPPDSLEAAILRRFPAAGAQVSADGLVGNGVTIAQVLSTLTILELDGSIRALPGGKYTLCEH